MLQLFYQEQIFLSNRQNVMLVFSWLWMKKRKTGCMWMTSTMEIVAWTFTSLQDLTHWCWQCINDILIHPCGFFWHLSVHWVSNFQMTFPLSDSWNNYEEQHSLLWHGDGPGAITQREGKIFKRLGHITALHTAGGVVSYLSSKLWFCYSCRVLVLLRGVPKMIWRTWPTLPASRVVTTLHREARL